MGDMKKILMATLLGLFWCFGDASNVSASTCGGGAVYCTAAPCTCTESGADDSCICSAQQCKQCNDNWYPCKCEFDEYGVEHCENVTICTNDNNSGSCPSYIDPCCNLSGCSGGGGGGGGGSPTPPPATHSECIGNSCTTVSGSGTNQCNTNSDCITSYTVRGRVRLATATWDGTSCTNPSSTTTVQPGSSSYIRVNSSGSTAVDSTGFWQTSVSSGTNVFTLVPSDPQYLVNCPPSGSYSKNITANTTGTHFYVTTQQIAWWQTRGGDVGAGVPNSWFYQGSE